MQENQSIAISCRGVHKHFGNGTRVQALRGVDFEARLGELTFIVGPSGCGKTTLLSVIDKRRKTWNYLWWDDGQRRSKQIGTLNEFPTKGAAWHSAQSFQLDAFKPLVSSKEADRNTVRALAERYEQERLPSRHS